MSAWGDPSYGGGAAPARSDIVRLFSTSFAFVALSATGELAAWGRAGYGGTDAPMGSGGANPKSAPDVRLEFSPSPHR